MNDIATVLSEIYNIYDTGRDDVNVSDKHENKDYSMLTMSKLCLINKQFDAYLFLKVSSTIHICFSYFALLNYQLIIINNIDFVSNIVSSLHY